MQRKKLLYNSTHASFHVFFLRSLLILEYKNIWNQSTSNQHLRHFLSLICKLFCFFSFHEHMDEFYTWAFEHNILKKQLLCHVCNADVYINLKSTKNSKICANYQCIKFSKHSKTIFSDSIFSNSKLEFSTLLVLMYAFIHDFKYSDIKRESLSNVNISSATISKYFKLFREIIFSLVEDIKNENELLGGEGKIIEVHECLIGNRKYNRGRFKISSWILGMVERKSGNVRFEIIKSRDQDT